MVLCLFGKQQKNPEATLPDENQQKLPVTIKFKTIHDIVRQILRAGCANTKQIANLVIIRDYVHAASDISVD